MKRIIHTFFLGMLCTISSLAQPFDVVLNAAQQGNITNQARNSITMAAGYSYTPNGGSMLSEIVNPVVIGIVSPSAVIDPSTYSINTALAVGKTKGGLLVNGMSNYNLSLDVPKGTRGLQPNINLSYMSSFNDGFLGLGWNIGGLSTINRVGQNLYFETQAQPIKGDLTDKYALDGKRLIQTNSGSYSYGVENSEYGTEIEEFSKITAKGGAGVGPDWFEVRTKSGLICEYGNTSDSKIIRDGSCILTWKVNKITDRYGNYIKFTYFESDDERPVLQIDYGTSTSLFANIYFRYKQRTDVSTYVYGGREFTRDLLLDNIEMKNNGLTFRKYLMEYCKVDNYTQLQKVTEYSSQNQPLNPTVFVYSDQTDQLSTNTSFYSSSSSEKFYKGDFNGDGRIEIVTVPYKTTAYTYSDMWKYYKPDASGNMQYVSTGNLYDNFEDILAEDFDGDGSTELMFVCYNQVTKWRDFHFKKLSGNSFVDINYGDYLSIDAASYSRYCVVDYDGDKKLEIMGYEPSYTDPYTTHPAQYVIYAYTGQGGTNGLLCQGSVPTLGTIAQNLIPYTGYTHIVDVNGDGCSDIIALNSNGYTLYEFKGTNNQLVSKKTGSNLKNSYLMLLGDFNGDGLTDIVRTDNSINGSYSMLTYSDNGFIDHEIAGLSRFDLSGGNNTIISYDVNGDQRNDIIFIGKGDNNSNQTNRINVAINKGNGYEYNFVEFSPLTFDLTANPAYLHFGDYNGDGRDELFYSKPGNQRCFSFATGTPSNLLTYVVDGLGAKTQITYKPMSDASVYTRGTGAAYPLSDFSSGMQLVRQTDTDDGIGGLFTITYKYEGAKVHLKGKGFLGFTKTTQTNEDTGISTENNYTFDSPYFYPKLMTSYTKQGSTAISTQTNTWGVSTYTEANRIFPYISSSTQTDDLKGLSVTTSAVYPASNPYGNASSVTKSYASGPTETTSFVYGDENASSWLIGRPTSITKTSTIGSDSQTYAITRTWMATSNDPDIDQNNTGDGSWWQLNRDYDSFGNLWKEHKATTGLTETHLIYDYDTTNGVNLIKTTDQVGNQTSYAYYTATGLLNTQTDPYGNTLTYSYNSADQLSSVVPSTGITYTNNSSLDVSVGPANARYYVDKTGNDGSETKTWFDKLGRELRAETRKFGGSLVKVDKQYNAKGELAQYSEPTTGTPSAWNIVGHDAYGRISQLDPVFGATTDYSYSGAITTRTINSRQYKTTENSAGWITSTEDPGGVITNGYWPNGQIRSVTNPQGYSTTISYDKNGNRLNIADPSVVNTSYSWYGTGQLKTRTNADGQTTTYTYNTDQKVQLLNHNTPDEWQTNYTYYSNGLVNSIILSYGPIRSYTYELGKIKSVSEYIDGISNTVTYEYDTKGRLYRKYFNGTTEYEQYDYDTNSGYLYRIQFTAAGNTTTVWQLSNMDDYNRATQATIGSTAASWTYDSGSNLLSGISATGVQGYAYAFDANTGNLNSRTNSLRTKTDYFGYDAVNLDRLTSVTGSTSPAVSVTYTSNKNGNIETKSDAGTYLYENTPYAVTKITGGQNISNDPQNIEYYSFEKVKKITEGTKTAEFAYNPDLQRMRMVLKDNGTVTRTKYYFGSSCEREIAGGVTTQYIWIGGDAYTAVAVAKKVGTGNWTVYNIFRDHLGTMTHLKSSTTDEYSFDAWGRRRNATNWTYTLDANDKALFADRGFTGHEFLADFNLYNMNGRLYDPVVGRFLSPDPYVQDPSFTQSLNRYSYCLNNPLKFTDPSGEFWNLLLVWGGNYVINWLDNSINKKMSPKEAFKQTPIMLSGNYSPSNNTFSNYQVEAYKAVVNQEKVWQQLKGVEAQWSGAESTTNKKATEKTVAMGWGVEANAFMFGINAGWFTTGETGGLVVTFTSGLSNSLSFNIYGASVTSNKTDFKVNNLSGKGMEYSGGWGTPSYTRSSDNFDNPSYRIHQVSFGLGYFNKSGGISNTGTIVIPTLPVLIVEPRY